jgi:hypothetical protein
VSGGSKLFDFCILFLSAIGLLLKRRSSPLTLLASYLLHLPPLRNPLSTSGQPIGPPNNPPRYLIVGKNFAKPSLSSPLPCWTDALRISSAYWASRSPDPDGGSILFFTPSIPANRAFSFPLALPSRTDLAFPHPHTPYGFLSLPSRQFLHSALR